MNEAIRQRIRRQANYQCEYCLTRERHLPFAAFHLDHIIARQHRGTDEDQNLAWSCHECNLHKGSNLTSTDPDTGNVVRLFNPRADVWNENFVLDGEYVRGTTPTGRATVWLLQMNSTERLELRAALRAAGEL
jgi:hypothetical protein